MIRFGKVKIYSRLRRSFTMDNRFLWTCLLTILNVESWSLPVEKNSMEFRIDNTWDGQSVNYDDVIITFSPDPHGDAVIMEVSAPYFNSPSAHPAPPGPVFKLWDYEVVEAFFLGRDNRYLEVELDPYGHHLLLFLDGLQNSVKHSLPLNYTAKVTDDFWSGKAIIPASYFPPGVSRFNAYAIHGEGEKRIYQSLYPVPQGKYSNPDFHRLDYFKSIDFGKLLPANPSACLSDIWKEAIQAKAEK